MDGRVWLIFAILLAYILYPALQTLVESVWTRGGGFTLEPWREFAARGHWRYGVRSVTLSLATAALSCVVGTAMAFVYARLEFPGRRLFAGLALLPFTLPPLVGVFAIWTLFAEGGPVHAITGRLGAPFWFETGFGGALLTHVYSMYVFYYAFVGEALETFDESQIEAARNLGAGRWRTLLTVMAPQLAPALTGATLLTLMTSMASFTAPFFYMAGRPTLTVGMQQALRESHEGLASADCVVLAMIAGVFLLLVMRFEGGAMGGAKGAARRRPAPVRSAAARWGLTLAAAAVSFLLLTPHIGIVRESFIRPGTGFVGSPVEFTLANYRRIFAETSFWEPVRNSLWASGAATLAVAAIGMLTAWMEERRGFVGRGFARWLLMLPWALPGTVIGIGLLWMTRRPNLLTLYAALRGTIAILALAYFIRLLPLAHRGIRAALARVPVELEGAARDLGATPARAFLRVTAPLILPAVIAAATLCFVTAMGEFVSSILLTGAGNTPIAVKIDQVRGAPGGVQVASAYSSLLTLLIAVAFILFGRGGRGQAAS